MSKQGKERHNGHFRICLNENNAKKAIVLSLQKEKKGQWLEEKTQGSSSL